MLMKCIANMLVSGWLGELTAAYFPYCHRCQHAQGVRSSFHGKLFKCNVQVVNHLVPTRGCWGQSFRKITWGCSFKGSLNQQYLQTLHGICPWPQTFHCASCFISCLIKLIHIPWASAWTIKSKKALLDLKEIPTNLEPLKQSHKRGGQRERWVNRRLGTSVSLNVYVFILNKDLSLATWPLRCCSY